MEEGSIVTKVTEVRLEELYCPYCGEYGRIDHNINMRFDKPLDEDGAQAIVHLVCNKCGHKFLLIHLGP